MSTRSKFIIENLGGLRRSAEFFGVTQGAVSQWKAGDIPPARMLQLLFSNPELFWAAQRVSENASTEEAA